MKTEVLFIQSKKWINFIAAGHQPAADHILERFEIFRSMVPWFDGSINLWLQRCADTGLLKQVPVFLLRATRYFVWLWCTICAEIVVYRMSAVFLNGLNGKNSSRSIVRNIFSVYFFLILGFKISYSEYSFVTQIVIPGIRIVSEQTSTWPVNEQVLAFTLFVLQLISSCLRWLFDEEAAYQHCCCFRISWIIKMNYKMVLKP